MSDPRRRAFVAVAIGCALLGCAGGSVPMLYKAGTLAPQRQADIDACTIASLKEIPQVIATRATGGYTVPGELECTTVDDRTICREVGRRDVPAERRDYDVNALLRQRYVNRCLTERGYAIIERPVCATREERAKVLREPHPATPEELTCSAGP